MAREEPKRCSRCGCLGELHREGEVERGCQLARFRTLLREADERLSQYALACPCPGVPCVSHCGECDKTYGLINRIRDLLR